MDDYEQQCRVAAPVAIGIMPRAWLVLPERPLVARRGKRNGIDMWYALIVAALSLAGAALPLRFRPRHAHLQLYLSLAAGALLGAALFHLLPESAEFVGVAFGLPAALGILVVFFLQRYLAPHSHELSPVEAGSRSTHKDQDDAIHEHPHSHSHREIIATAHNSDEHAHGHVHGAHCSHDVPGGEELRHLGHHERAHSAGPFLTGLIAIFALSIHSLFDGIALGAASTARTDDGAPLILSVFLSVLVHKPMDGLSVSVLLLQAGVATRKLWLVQIFYAALVPIGAIGFRFVEHSLDDASLYVGYTLSFSAGTFLAIALTDLLPELHFHRHDRNKLSAALLLGLAVMWLTSLIGHGENGHDHGIGQEKSKAEHLHEGHEH